MNDTDVHSRKDVCVIGTNINNEFYPNKNQMGKTLLLNGREYIIAGIRKETEKSRKNSEDDYIYVTYTNISRLIGICDILTFLFGLYSAKDISKAEVMI